MIVGQEPVANRPRPEGFRKPILVGVNVDRSMTTDLASTDLGRLVNIEQGKREGSTGLQVYRSTGLQVYRSVRL